jgi:Gram-negative bacterial TonB protein C-terminal
VLVLLACLTCADGTPADDNPPAGSEDPTKIGLMTPEAKSELDNCAAQAAETSADGRDRRVMIGVYIGPKGRPVSLAILESSGLEHLDKLVLRCIFRAHYTPSALDKPPTYWVFTTTLKAKRTVPPPSASGIAFLRVHATDTTDVEHVKELRCKYGTDE